MRARAQEICHLHFPVRAVGEAQGGAGDHLDGGQALDVALVVFRVLVDVHNADHVAADDLQDAVARLGRAQFGLNGTDEVLAALAQRFADDILLVAALGLHLDLEFLAALEQHHQVLVVDLDEEALAGLGEAFARGVERDAGADHLQRLDGIGPAAQLEVALPDVVVGLVGKDAPRELVRHLAQRHESPVVVVHLVMADAQAVQPFRLFVEIVRSFQLLELLHGQLIVAFLRQVLAQRQVSFEAHLGLGEQLRDRLEELDRAFFVLRLIEQLDALVQDVGGLVVRLAVVVRGLRVGGLDFAAGTRRHAEEQAHREQPKGAGRLAFRGCAGLHKAANRLKIENRKSKIHVCRPLSAGP
ncbi:MAG: hypothetical protein ABSE73_10020 [Planctomycetota bacterium]